MVVRLRSSSQEICILSILEYLNPDYVHIINNGNIIKTGNYDLALEIEKEYDKDEIFELYVNVIYFGSGYYNIYDASQGYFDKPPVMLNDYECTMLAGIPQAPSVYSLDENPDLAEERRQQVVTCMIEEGYIEAGDIM